MVSIPLNGKHIKEELKEKSSCSSLKDTERRCVTKFIKIQTMRTATKLSET